MLSTAYRPEVVDHDIEDAQDHHQDDGTPLRFEAYHHHNTSHRTKANHNQSTYAEVSCKDEADEQENEQHSSSKLKVHLPVLLVELREACRRKLLAHPTVGKHHE